MKIHFDLPIIAHRGASALAPENTLAAFMKAKELGLTWVEFDVQLSASGEVVVIHDDDLYRTTHTNGKVIDYPYRFIKTLDAGSWFDPKFAREKISTLAEILAFLDREKMAANVEIKSLPGYEAILSKYAMNALAEFHMPLLISSFSRTVLEHIRQLNENITIGYLMDEWHTDWEKFCDHIQATSVNVNHNILTKERIHSIKSTDRFLLAYTVDSAMRAQELLALGVDAVFSNCHTGFVETFRS